MHNRDEIEGKIKGLIQSRCRFNGGNPSMYCDLRDNYGIDSIALVELLIGIESEFDITIDSSLLTYECFSTGNAIVEYVADTLSRKSA